MTFINDSKKIIWEIIDQRKRRLPSLASCQMPGIVFNTAAIAHFFHHFKVIIGPLFEAFGLKEFSFFMQDGKPRLQFFPDISAGPFQILITGHIMTRWEDGHMGPFIDYVSCKDIDFHDAVHFITKKLNTDALFVVAGRNDFNDITAGPKRTALQDQVISFITNLDKFFQDGIAIDLLPNTEGKDAVIVILWCT